jgi:hypothetical protein
MEKACMVVASSQFVRFIDCKSRREFWGNRLCLLSVLLWLLYNRAIEEHYFLSCSDVSLTGIVGCALVLQGIGFRLLLQHITDVKTN